MGSTFFKFLVGLGLAGVGSSAVEAVEDWPEWRGAGGQGHSEAQGVPVVWGETENVRWRTEVDGRGYSTPVVGAGKVWMTAATETEASEAEKKKRLTTNTGGQPLTVLEKVSLRVVCVDLESGRLEHDIEVFEVKAPQWVHKLNSYASPSPVLEGDRLYVHYGTFGTACLAVGEGTPEIVWKNDELPVMHENGPGSTPVVVGEHVIFHADGSDVQYVVGLDKRTGKVAWKTDRSGKLKDHPQMKKAYGTPLVLSVEGKLQIVSTGADWLYGYDPETGKELWKMSYGQLGFSNVSRPVAGHGLVYFCTGFMRGALVAVRIGADGAEEVWKYERNVPNISSPLVVGDEVYMVGDEGGLVTCLDAKSGEVHWRERIAGGKYMASPSFADGRIYFHGLEGTTTVLEPGTEFKVIAENELEGKLNASGVFLDGTVLLRTEDALYRIGNGE